MMSSKLPRTSTLFAFVVLTLTACGKVADPALEFSIEELAPLQQPEARPRDANRQVFFGDLHIHSSYSFDAYTMGVRSYPEDAYTFAKGGEIRHGVGYPISIDRPLDFAAVSDHAEYLGVARRKAELADAGKRGEAYDAELLAALKGYPFQYFWRLMREGMRSSSAEAREENFAVPQLAGATVDAWRDIRRAADVHNTPGSFTTFVAYEWSSMPRDQHLHRVVLYGSEHVPELPWSSLESENPEDLWRELDRQRGAGHDVLAIPHNSNLSNGLMFSRTAIQRR